MSQVLLVRGEGGVLPALFAPDAKTAERVIEFFYCLYSKPEHPQSLCEGDRHLCVVVR
jgi:hypothetical protein